MDQGLLLSFADIEERHWWFVVRNRIALEAIVEAAVESPATILEVGCGTGGMLHRLQDAFPHARVIGIEPSDAAVAVARQRGCEAENGVLESLPCESDSIEVVAALDVLEHCADDRSALAEAARVLAPGGALVVTVPALPSLWSPHDEANEHFRRYTRTTLTEALLSAGLVPERVAYFNSLLLPIGFGTRLVSRVTGSRAMSGVEVPWEPVNAMMNRVFSAELPFVRRGFFPAGMSLLAVARRPVDGVQGDQR